MTSFLFFLSVSEWYPIISHTGPIGRIVVGLIYGVPIGSILALEWHETSLALGYDGLLLIIFEAGLIIRLDLLRQNLALSVIAALLGVLTPIALSFAWLYAGFGHGTPYIVPFSCSLAHPRFRWPKANRTIEAALETFIVSVALCSTSLGTTLVVINSASALPAASTSPRAASVPSSSAPPSSTTCAASCWSAFSAGYTTSTTAVQAWYGSSDVPYSPLL